MSIVRQSKRKGKQPHSARRHVTQNSRLLLCRPDVCHLTQIQSTSGWAARISFQVLFLSAFFAHGQPPNSMPEMAAILGILPRFSVQCGNRSGILFVQDLELLALMPLSRADPLRPTPASDIKPILVCILVPRPCYPASLRTLGRTSSPTFPAAPPHIFSHDDPLACSDSGGTNKISIRAYAMHSLFCPFPAPHPKCPHSPVPFKVCKGSAHAAAFHTC